MQLQGLRTVIYPANDLDAARAWWTGFLGIDPYFVEPFYVGFEVAGYELGLLPDATSRRARTSTGAWTTWPRPVDEALTAGATLHPTRDGRRRRDRDRARARTPTVGWSASSSTRTSRADRPAHSTGAAGGASLSPA